MLNRQIGHQGDDGLIKHAVIPQLLPKAVNAPVLLHNLRPGTQKNKHIAADHTPKGKSGDHGQNRCGGIKPQPAMLFQKPDQLPFHLRHLHAILFFLRLLSLRPAGRSFHVFPSLEILPQASATVKPAPRFLRSLLLPALTHSSKNISPPAAERTSPSLSPGV